MNMIPTFRELGGWNLTDDLRTEAMRCVRIHGCGGIGDPYGALQIWDLKAAYVLMCVGCELTRNPENDLALNLTVQLAALFEKYNKDPKKG